jgi:AAA domain, putative AbiEii toxin, Type IV TA system/AAA domain
MKTKPLPDLDPTKGYLTSLTLENIRCFGSPAETLSLTKPGSDTQPARWTVILGANGVGKTTVLRALAACRGNLDDYAYEFNKKVLRPMFFRNEEEIGKVNWSTSNEQKLNSMLTNHQFQRRGSLVLNQIGAWNPALIAGYGALRSWMETYASRNPYASLFDRHSPVRNPSQTLSDWTAFGKSKGGNATKWANRLRDAFIAILPDVTAVDLDFDDDRRPFIKFQTPDGWIALDDMSWGYQVFAAFAADYASRLIEWYPNSKTPLAEPGICLVDELDLHMHPSWQRKVIDDLSNIFPATQFIVTVHSPLVVQAAEDANLVVLKRYPDDPSRVQIDNDVEAIKGWRIDQVLTSDLFGLESSRPPSVADDLAERRKLLGNDDLTAEEAARLKILEEQAMSLPTPGGSFEQEALKLVAEAAAKLKQLG